jgi:hypothetical protein
VSIGFILSRAHDRAHRRPNLIRWRWRAGDMVNHLHIKRKLSNDNDIFRTVRELLQSNKCVLMGNAVNNDGKLYDDSVENLTAILAMQDSYSEMLAALNEYIDEFEGGLSSRCTRAQPPPAQAA